VNNVETLVFLGDIFILLSFLLFIVAVALYIIFSIGLYQMAKNAGLENSWLAFVPIAQMYIMGKLIKEIKVKDFVIPSAELVLPIAFVVLILCGGIPLIGQLLALAGFVLYLAACYNVYLLYRPNNAVTYTIISILSVTVPFLFYMMRNDPMVHKQDENQDEKQDEKPSEDVSM